MNVKGMGTILHAPMYLRITQKLEINKSNNELTQKKKTIMRMLLNNVILISIYENTRLKSQDLIKNH